MRGLCDEYEYSCLWKYDSGGIKSLWRGVRDERNDQQIQRVVFVQPRISAVDGVGHSVYVYIKQEGSELEVDKPVRIFLACRHVRGPG